MRELNWLLKYAQSTSDVLAEEGKGDHHFWKAGIINTASLGDSILMK
jgi:hypothetical protein